MWVRSDVVPTRVASLPVGDFFSSSFVNRHLAAWHGVRHFLAVFREKIKLVVV